MVTRALRGRQRQRRHRELALAVDAQHHAAGDEHGERRTRVEQIADEARGAGHLLEVVDQQQRPAHAGQVVRDRRQQRALTRFAQPERRRNRRDHERRIGNRRQIDERDAALECRGEIRGDLDGQPCLAGAARPGQCHEAHGGVEQRGRDRRRLRVAPQQRRPLRRQRAAARLRGRRRETGAADRRRRRSPMAASSSRSTSAAAGARLRGFASIRSNSRSNRAGRWRHAPPRTRRVARGDGVQHAERRSRLERMRAGGQLVQHDAEREDVARACPRSRRAPAPETCSGACRGSRPRPVSRPLRPDVRAAGSRRARPKSSSFT